MSATSPHRVRARLAVAVRLALGIALLALSTVVLATPGGRADAAAPDATSAVTVAGHGAFSNVKVTVDQTTHLINQVVRVSWAGAAPTIGPSGLFKQDFMQIMQCWGDDPSGPTREQCQFGATTAQKGGPWVISRQIDTTVIDQSGPAEKAYSDQWGGYVPFFAADGVTSKGGKSPYFDANTTNEVPYGRTSPNGTGEVYFEMQTATEAAGLGCGAATSTSSTGHPCWLVVVPRGETESDGTTLSPNTDLQTSPLTATNWANRIVVPLSFDPVSPSCPIGSAEQRVVGDEQITEAVTRWQPSLCKSTSVVYGYSQLTDAGTRGQLTSGQPGLGVVNLTASAEDVSPTAPLIYAPIAVSGLTIAFDYTAPSNDGSSADVKAKDGTRVTDLNLTPRLIAKLLTQSYGAGGVPGETALNNNPPVLNTDPDFLQFNAQFKNYGIGVGDNYLFDMLTPLPGSDAAAVLWLYVLSDKEASAFISGAPDPWGMVVNPAYKNLPLGSVFPKLDQACYQSQTDPQPLCNLDRHPYASDMHNAAYSASRGDPLKISGFDVSYSPPKLSKAPRQSDDRRGLMAISDTATAARYGLATAKLRNSAGQFVAPTTDSMTAAIGAMLPDSNDPTALIPNPLTTSPTAYPLTLVSYAATAPSEISKSDGKNYADFIRYAVTDGQTPGIKPGDLPDGYAPLPDPLRATAQTAADRIESGAGIPVTNDDAGDPDGGDATAPNIDPGSGGPDAPSDSGPLPNGAPADPAVAAAVAANSSPANKSTVAYSTKKISSGAGHYAIAIIAALAGLAVLGGPVGRFYLTRLRR